MYRHREGGSKGPNYPPESFLEKIATLIGGVQQPTPRSPKATFHEELCTVLQVSGCRSEEMRENCLRKKKAVLILRGVCRLLTWVVFVFRVAQ
jgi:hypothetical protein